MRATILTATSVCVGILSAIVIVGVSSWNASSPITVLERGTTEVVPAYWVVNTSQTICSPHPCGGPGEWSIGFSVMWDARLTGSVHSSAALQVWIGNVQAMGAACELDQPPPPCAPPPPGPAFLYETPTSVTQLDLGGIDLGFEGGNHLPPGSWSILFINESPSPVTISVTSAIIVSQT